MGYIKISLETVKLNTFYSLNPPAGDISLFSSIFVAVGLVVVASGLFLFIVKSE